MHALKSSVSMNLNYCEKSCMNFPEIALNPLLHNKRILFFQVMEAKFDALPFFVCIAALHPKLTNMCFYWKCQV